MKRGIISIFVLMTFTGSVYALPFNDDMVNTQEFVAGETSRQKPDGSVAVGVLDYRVKDKAEAEKLTNPLKGDAKSAMYGKRLFQVNCSPCHGSIESKPYTPGPVAAKFASPPDITGETYKQKSDGYIYGTIHFGGMALMPALGWKLSPTEHWDIVNYIRKVQQDKR